MFKLAMPKQTKKAHPKRAYVLTSPAKSGVPPVEAPSPKSAVKKIFNKLTSKDKKNVSMVITIMQVPLTPDKKPKMFTYRVMRKSLAKPRKIIDKKTKAVIATITHETKVMKVKK
jgi:hypothetical protein